MKLYLSDPVEYQYQYVELIGLLSAQLTQAELQSVYATFRSYEAEAEQNRAAFNQYVRYAPSLKISAT